MAMSRKRRVLAARGMIEVRWVQISTVLHEIMMHEQTEQMYEPMPEVQLPSCSCSDHQDASFKRTFFMPVFLWN